MSSSCLLLDDERGLEEEDRDLDLDLDLDFEEESCSVLLSLSFLLSLFDGLGFLMVVLVR
ncbi:MAG TPA: hypothetical protein VM660_05640 [Bacillus sp. (in: firmicutes)]|nr:hypothetical protein [Bacillus sp. (in: firmicutes)]